jgi:hypothetical protein
MNMALQLRITFYNAIFAEKYCVIVAYSETGRDVITFSGERDIQTSTHIAKKKLVTQLLTVSVSNRYLEKTAATNRHAKQLRSTARWRRLVETCSMFQVR